jgi:isopenicillin N synthase-like dioxygenase
MQDYGTLTLLFQDSVGGLEVQNPHTSTFIPATPVVRPLSLPLAPSYIPVQIPLINVH